MPSTRPDVLTAFVVRRNADGFAWLRITNVDNEHDGESLCSSEALALEASLFVQDTGK